MKNEGTLHTQKRHWVRFARDENGSVILETALMLVVLLVLAFGIVDFGRLMFVENSLISAARDGARFGAVQETYTAAAVKSVVRSRFNTYTFGGDTLTDADITASGSGVQQVQVVVTYSFKWISPVAKLLWNANSSFRSTVHARAVYRYEFGTTP